MKKRLFLAIQLPKEIKGIFTAYSKRYNINGIRWTAPENLHITVYFIGYMEESDLPKAAEKTERVLKNIQPFELKFQNIEFAPPNRPARMIWAVFSDKNGVYKKFVDSMYEALKNFSYKDYRGKEAIAHVTLARFHDPSIAYSLDLKQQNTNEGIFQVPSCDLMESELLHEGPAYKILKTFELGGAVNKGLPGK